MRAVLQRVARASVRVDGATVGEIGGGLLVLLGVEATDDEETAERLAAKVARLRVFERGGRFDASLLDLVPRGAGETGTSLSAGSAASTPPAGAALVVSQFTLLADARRGNRPSFSAAAPPERAEPLYERFCAALAALGVPVATGRFGARMQVDLTNDGPVTLVLDADARPTGPTAHRR